MKQIFYLIILTIIIVSCAEANDPVEIEDSSDFSYEITNIYSTNGIAQDVDISDDYVFIAEDQYGFSIFEKESGAMTCRVDSFAGNFYSDVRLISYSDDTELLWVYNKYNTTSLHMYDVADMTNPVFVSGAIGELSGILEMNVTDNTSGNVYISYLKDDNTFLTGEIIASNIWSYSVSIPDVISFSEDSTYVYVAGDQRGIFIVEKMGEANPMILGQADTPGLAYDVAVQGNYAYVADKHMGLSVVDISDKTNPQFVYNYSDTYGHARDIVANDEIVAIGSGGGGIYVFSIEENPAEPKLIGQIDDIGYNQGVEIDGDVLYAVSRDLGIVQIHLDD